MVDTISCPFASTYNWVVDVWDGDSWLTTGKNVINSIGQGVFEIFESNFIKKRRSMGHRGLDVN